MSGAATALPSGLAWEQFPELLDRDEYKSAELIDGRWSWSLRAGCISGSWQH